MTHTDYIFCAESCLRELSENDYDGITTISFRDDVLVVESWAGSIPWRCENYGLWRGIYFSVCEKVVLYILRLLISIVCAVCDNPTATTNPFCTMTKRRGSPNLHTNRNSKNWFKYLQCKFKNYWNPVKFVNSFRKYFAVTYEATHLYLSRSSWTYWIRNSTGTC